MIEGICKICGKNGLLSTCQICGVHACSHCFDNSMGMCKKCARKYKTPKFGKF